MRRPAAFCQCTAATAVRFREELGAGRRLTGTWLGLSIQCRDICSLGQRQLLFRTWPEQVFQDECLLLASPVVDEMRRLSGIRTLPLKLMTWVQPTRNHMLEERSDSCKLSSDRHVHACTHILTRAHTHYFFLIKTKFCIKKI